MNAFDSWFLVVAAKGPSSRFVCRCDGNSEDLVCVLCVRACEYIYVYVATCAIYAFQCVFMSL